MSIFNELKRRNVFRVGIAYGIASWVLLQVADLVLENINAPEWVIQTMMLMVGLGFIAALVIAWAYEMTPEGIKKEADVDRSQSITGDTSKKLDKVVIGFLIIAVLILLYRQSEMGSGSISPDIAETQTTTENEKLNLTPTTATTPEKISIAVLPFVNMSSDPEQEYFSDGLAEELLNRLAKNDQLHVAARTSAFQFKGKNLDIADIGRQLHVAYVLEGSVRKAGNRLRITAQLIQVDNGFHLWSETYEREIDDIFAIQDDISLAISKALEIELGTADSSSGYTQATSNIEAYNYYLQARYLLAQRGDKNMRQANDLFAQAVALDPEFSSAWSGMAFNSTLLFGYSFTMSLDESFDMTMKAAKRAIELDPQNAEAYSAIGRTLSDTLDWKGAQKSFERAYEIGPNDVSVVNLYGDFMSVVGNFDQAINLKRQAIELDPLSAVHASDLALELIVAGEYEEALISARRGVSLAPTSPSRISSLVQALILKNAFAETQTLIEQTARFRQENKGFESSFSRWWAMLYYRQNDTEKLRQLITKSIRLLGTDAEDIESLGPTLIGFYLLSLDGVAAALPWLEQAFTEREGDLTWPFLFYLPERMSDDPDWLEFWDQPDLKELLNMRRATPYPDYGLWMPNSDAGEPAL